MSECWRGANGASHAANDQIGEAEQKAPEDYPEAPASHPEWLFADLQPL